MMELEWNVRNRTEHLFDETDFELQLRFLRFWFAVLCLYICSGSFFRCHYFLPCDLRRLLVAPLKGPLRLGLDLPAYSETTFPDFFCREVILAVDKGKGITNPSMH